jgi:hypothetical protein
MLATDNFTMRISPQDKAMLAAVATHFQRTQADTIKTLVREVYQFINVEGAKENQSAMKAHRILGEEKPHVTA